MKPQIMRNVLPYYTLGYLLTCVIKSFVLSCLFLSGIMVLQCFVYKLDCEQLKLVCQSMETWLHITLLFHAVKVRAGNVRVNSEQMKEMAPVLKTSTRITSFIFLSEAI